MSMEVNKKGVAGVSIANVIFLLANQYARNYPDIIAQLVENAFDAGAMRVVIDLWPGYLRVIDNGMGMLPEMTPKDREAIQLFLDMAAGGGLKQNDDPKTLVSKVSLRSLEWCMRYIALSAKKFLPVQNPDGTTPRGVLGIGSVAPHQISGAIQVISRPELELARAIWGPKLRQEDVPTHVLIRPTTEQLLRQDSSWNIHPYKKPFVDELKRPLTSGTIVECRELVPGVEQVLTVSKLGAHLARRFTKDIFEQGRIIEIHGSLTSDSLRRKVTRVQPVVYQGIELVRETCTITVQGGMHPFAVQIMLNLKASGGLQVRRLGSDVGKLTDIDGFQSFPWTDKLTGFVEFPDVPNRLAPWNPDKTQPLLSETLTLWKERLHELAPRIETELKRREQAQKDENLQQFSKNFARRTGSVLQAMSIFMDPKASKGASGKREGASSRTARVEDRVVVHVHDQYNKGVGGVEFDLRRGSVELARRTTMKSGMITFGKHDVGEYVVDVITMPSGVEIEGPRHYTIRLTESYPGRRITIRMYVPDAEAPKGLAPNIDIQHRALEDLGTFFDSARFASAGILVVNSEAEGVRDAIQDALDGDFVPLELIYDACMAQAVGLHLSGQGWNPEDIAQTCMQLFVKLRNENEPAAKRGRR